MTTPVFKYRGLPVKRVLIEDVPALAEAAKVAPQTTPAPAKEEGKKEEKKPATKESTKEDSKL